MRVRYKGKSSVSLSKGKIYNVISIEHRWYRIIDNTQSDYLFDPDEFEIIENEKLQIPDGLKE